MREGEVQRMFFKMLNERYPNVVAFAIPNGFYSAGGARHVARMRSEGMLPGVPDVAIMQPSGGYHGMFIEFKSPGKQPSERQAQMIQRLRNVGYYVVVCFSAKEAIEKVEKYLSLQDNELV